MVSWGRELASLIKVEPSLCTVSRGGPVLLNLSDSCLAEYPLELLPVQGKPLGLRFPVQRIMPDINSRSREPSHSGFRLLVVESRGACELGLPGMKGEIEAIERFNDLELKKRGNLLVDRWSWTEKSGLDELQMKIQENDAVHFVGHVGNKQGGHSFQLCSRTDKWISFEQMFPKGNECGPHFVWLNTCHGGKEQDGAAVRTLLHAGCRNGLACTEEMHDELAKNLVDFLYPKIAEGEQLSWAILDLRKYAEEGFGSHWASLVSYGPGDSFFKPS